MIEHIWTAEIGENLAQWRRASLNPHKVEHRTRDPILRKVNFRYNMAVQGTTQIMPFKLVYGRSQATTLDAMLPTVTDQVNRDFVVYLQRA